MKFIFLKSCSEHSKSITYKTILIIMLFLSPPFWRGAGSVANAQDDLSGVYVDGVKTTELNCASFGEMVVVFPFEKLKSYDGVSVYASVEYNREVRSSRAHSISKMPINGLDLKSFTYKGSSYLKITIFEKSNQKSSFYIAPSMNYKMPDQLTRSSLVHDYKNDIGKVKDLKILIHGLTIKGQTESYNADCKCIIKEPSYNGVEYKTFYISLKNSTQLKGFAKTFDDVNVDLTPECIVSGTKVDFNNLGKSEDSSNKGSNSNTNFNTTNNASVKTETPAKTSDAMGKTIITTVAPTSATAVKLLDKTKPGYFEERSEDKKSLYRNGYQKTEGVYHGEVREYDNNELYKIIMYTDGIEDGLHIIFEDGKVSWIGNYKNGKKDGAWKHYKNGALEETEKYINGEKQD